MRISLWRRLTQGLTRPVSRTERRLRTQRVGATKLEELESRDVPSVTVHPEFVLETPQHGVTPAAGGGIAGYTPAQIGAGYGFNQISDTGSGTTIAIVDAYSDPNIAADLTTFDTEYGLPAATLKVVNQSGGTSLPKGNTGWAEEISLDVEWAHAMAPGASILLVEATNASMTDLGKAAEFAATQKGVVAVSMSWGGSEYSNETGYDHYFEAPSSNPNVVFIAASGDSGPPAEYPSTSPYVMSVGGTSLTLSSSGAWESETAWSDSTGGTSTVELAPTWQDNDGITTKYRTDPDVAYDANPSTGFAVYDSYSFSKSEAWEEFGGTSCGAPQWAAIVADTDQARSAAGQLPLDNAVLMPLLYNGSSSSVFHDITSGSSGSNKAGPGYDLVTGWGSPIVNNLVPYLSGTPSNGVTHFSIAPSSGGETAGTQFPITVEALNSSNQVVTNFAGTVTFTSTGAGDQIEIGTTWYTLSSSPTFTFATGDDGEATFNLKLAGTGSDTVTVADGSLNGSATYTVSAPYFTLSGLSPSTIYAGTQESFTLTAYLPGSILDSGYDGTVNFTSTNPSSTQFSIGAWSNGSATVTVTFDKAGSSQTITATDSVDTAMTGSEANLTVLPGAPTQLLFLQGPTGANLNTAISPAITVEELDQFNNVVTTDSSSSVTLTFGTNTTGGTLGGNLTATVVDGVATFNDVTVNTAGTYTLVATDTLADNLTPTPPNGTLTTPPSSSFTISASTTGVIENFTNGLGSYYYYGSSRPLVGISKAAAHTPTASDGLYDEGDGNWYFREDSGAVIAPGDTVTAWIDFDSAANGRAYLGFGTYLNGSSDMGTYSVVLAPNTDQFIIQSNPQFVNYNNLAVSTQKYSANSWYLVKVEWSTTGNVIADLYASNGTTLLNSIEATDVSTTAGPFAFRAIGSTKYFSTVSLTTGVNNFVVTSPGGSTGGTHTTPPSPPTLPTQPSLPWLLGGIELQPTSSHQGKTLAEAILYSTFPESEEWFW